MDLMQSPLARLAAPLVFLSGFGAVALFARARAIADWLSANFVGEGYDASTALKLVGAMLMVNLVAGPMLAILASDRMAAASVKLLGGVVALVVFVPIAMAFDVGAQRDEPGTMLLLGAILIWLYTLEFGLGKVLRER